MRWWPRRRRNGDAQAAAEQEAKLRAAQRMGPVYEALAPLVAELPDEEFAERVARAFRRRPA